jgi:tRNA (guanine37-N1)-methyltransferase
MWSVTLLTLFPEMFPGPLGQSLAGKANEKGLWDLKTINIRDFAPPPHHRVDDKSFGGGTGLVMQPDVIGAAIESVIRPSSLVPRKTKDERRIYFSPRGRLFDQQMAEELVKSPEVLMLCGRYEGVDQRVLDYYEFEEVSVGDFILSGGEIAAFSVIDACLRLIPGVIGKENVHAEESFSAGLLEYPHYTRPAVWQGLSVPEVLVSGHHANVRDWRLQQAEEITKNRRADLWEIYKRKL